MPPWTDVVKLHPDVESGNLTESVFAVDLGAIAAKDSNVPVVNRNPDEFLRATYLTADLRKLLAEALGSLAGKPGYNRVLKLRTPFGGGKLHALAALLHAARSRDSLAAWLPRFEAGKLAIDKVEVGGRPRQATGVHERTMELLTAKGVKKVHSTVTPGKVKERVRLGDAPCEGAPPQLGVSTSEMTDAFFRVLSPPRLESDQAIRGAIARGVEEGVFAYTSGAVPELGPDGRFLVNRGEAACRRRGGLGERLRDDARGSARGAGTGSVSALRPIALCV